MKLIEIVRGVYPEWPDSEVEGITQDADGELRCAGRQDLDEFPAGNILAEETRESIANMEDKLDFFVGDLDGGLVITKWMHYHAGRIENGVGISISRSRK